MEIFVARQPIFDRNQNIYAYELLFRSSLENFYAQSDWDHATASVLNHSFFSIGLDNLTRGKKAFINFTSNLLLNGVASIFPREQLGIEILEDVEAQPEIVAECRRLKQLGYLLVLDDFAFHPGCEPLLELADIVKVDFLHSRPEEIALVRRKINAQTCKLLAEKLETKASYRQAFEMGFSFFQGYFFEKPEIIVGRELPGYKLAYLQLLQRINQPDASLDDLDDIIRHDVSLSFRLLRLINSAFFGFHNPIRSIRHALSLLGMKQAKKWLSVIALSGIAKDQSEALILSSLLRANFCELIAPRVQFEDRSSELFLMGLFSLLDTLMCQPMSAVLAKIPLSQDIRAALLGQTNRLRQILDLVIAYEKGDWRTFSEMEEKLNLSDVALSNFFHKAIEISNQTFIC